MEQFNLQLYFLNIPNNKVYGAEMTQVGPMLGPWTLLSGISFDIALIAFSTCQFKSLMAYPKRVRRNHFSFYKLLWKRYSSVSLTNRMTPIQ